MKRTSSSRTCRTSVSENSPGRKPKSSWRTSPSHPSTRGKKNSGRISKKSEEGIREEALNRKPVPFEPPDEPNQLAAMGPYSTGSPLGYVSEKQEELKKDLSRELEKMQKREYPGYY
ncbi:hypothetical protein AKJ40_03145 [candidate division MSBL1 archaeon SCGC-AAA259M10]|uniref:Uncharacterized protein n=1 Tax=candidate division MSBL1 archaeon SCGC-AAA259M10 TaxID=1698270 RepID=A0A133UZ44_9EURY|nr:hypothetical protein AKJ40_03145 [candidate division MSBL1 archaeon SCGC-AAA259M10]